jgi:stage II sporulation protein D
MSARSLFLSLVIAAVAAGSAAGTANALDAPVCTGTCYAAPPGSGALLLFSGHGWGHGVGMSQYGAYGYAQHGSTYQQILAHYYPGTTLGSTPVTLIRVLLANKRKTLKLSSTVPFTVLDGAGQTHTLDPGTVALDPALKLPVDGQTAQPLPPPLTFIPGAGAPLTLTRPYRGKILVDVVDDTLRAIDVVSLEQYLYGVVPSEMPSNWSPEALQAQAVAARSYALATKAVGAPFDVYPDSRSQMYLGLSQEKAAASAAVDATKGQVLLYGGKVATTYFYSTSGGQTESSADWKGTALPYLVSVPDPYDDISPYHDWGPVPVTGKAIDRALKLSGTLTDAATLPNETGRVHLLRLVSTSPLIGSTTTDVPGPKAQDVLGLRSTWFDIGVLSLTTPSPNQPIVYGSPVQLNGVARGLGAVTLEQRSSGGSWQSVGPVTPAADGTLEVAEKPTITTDYRLATPGAAAAYVRIRVTPLVRVTSTANGGVQGTERPVIADASVQIQQQAVSGAWTTVATGAVGGDGSFAVPAQLASGVSYRVVVTPGRGYSPGMTSGLTLVR